MDPRTFKLLMLALGAIAGALVVPKRSEAPPVPDAAPEPVVPPSTPPAPKPSPKPTSDIVSEALEALEAPEPIEAPEPPEPIEAPEPIQVEATEVSTPQGDA